jgi:hypothetical protein
MEYQEKQHLKLWWLYILLGIDAIVVSSIVFLDKGGMTFEQLKSIYFAPILAILLPFAIVYFVTKNKLTLIINTQGVTYHYWPFARNKFVAWSDINLVYLRKYDAFSEYGGWGMRYRLWFKFNDKAYILNDNNIGLQLELKNKKKLLFSTMKAEELELFLVNLKRQFHIGAIEDARER